MDLASCKLNKGIEFDTEILSVIQSDALSKARNKVSITYLVKQDPCRAGQII